MTPLVYSNMSPCVRSVADAVAGAYGIHPTKLFRRPPSRASFARSVALFVCHAELGMSVSELAREFGVRFHNSKNAIERIAKMVAADDISVVAGLTAGEQAASSWIGISA